MARCEAEPNGRACAHEAALGVRLPGVEGVLRACERCASDFDDLCVVVVLGAHGSVRSASRRISGIRAALAMAGGYTRRWVAAMQAGLAHDLDVRGLALEVA